MRSHGFGLIDKNKKILIIYENSFPITLRKWGFPKGVKKISESNLMCAKRELKEETGIDLQFLNYKIIRVCSNNTCVITIVSIKTNKNIKIIKGKEILKYKWISIDELQNECLTKPDLYNNSIKTIFKKNSNDLKFNLNSL